MLGWPRPPPGCLNRRASAMSRLMKTEARLVPSGGQRIRTRVAWQSAHGAKPVYDADHSRLLLSAVNTQTCYNPLDWPHDESR